MQAPFTPRRLHKNSKDAYDLSRVQTIVSHPSSDANLRSFVVALTATALPKSSIW